MKHKYYLMAKLSAVPISKYRGDAVRISDIEPKKYDEVWIGVKRNPQKVRKITTFRDKAGNIIERSFDYSDGKLRNRVYTRRTLNIGKKETVYSTTIKDYFINKRVIPFYNALLDDYKETHPIKDMLWNLTCVLTNHLSINKKNNGKILSQTKISNIQTPTKQRHTFTEFPHFTEGKTKKSERKFLTFLVNSLTNKFLKGSEEMQNVKFPENDRWLPFRALTIKDSKEPFASEFIREKKIQKAMIEINPEYFPKNENEKLYAADFNPEDGSINFNRLFKPYSKTRVIGIARHEAEHVWQYFLNSRIAESTTEWEEFIHRTFGKIRSKSLCREAKRYAKAIRKYVSLTKELEENGNVNEYRENYIEKEAQKAAAKIRKEYDKQGAAIRESFPHIPKEYL